jgi:hypothetical protein
MDPTDQQTDLGGRDKALVHSVKRVDYAFLLRYPPYLHISVEGYVNTEGWGDAELRIRKPESPISDGILELDLVARPPLTAGVQALTSVRAEITWEEGVYQIRGAQVYSTTNSIKKLFAEGVMTSSPAEAPP